jgi:hypothetical protein
LYRFLTVPPIVINYPQTIARRARRIVVGARDVERTTCGEHLFIAGPLIATALVFGGRYAMARGVEVEVLDVADLDIIGSALIAIGFLVFAFSFFFGVYKLAHLPHFGMFFRDDGPR